MTAPNVARQLHQSVIVQCLTKGFAEEENAGSIAQPGRAAVDVGREDAGQCGVTKQWAAMPIN
jgi:hypothetical protein